MNNSLVLLLIDDKLANSSLSFFGIPSVSSWCRRQMHEFYQPPVARWLLTPGSSWLGFYCEVLARRKKNPDWYESGLTLRRWEFLFQTILMSGLTKILQKCASFLLLLTKLLNGSPLLIWKLVSSKDPFDMLWHDWECNYFFWNPWRWNYFLKSRESYIRRNKSPTNIHMLLDRRFFRDCWMHTQKCFPHGQVYNSNKLLPSTMGIANWLAAVIAFLYHSFTLRKCLSHLTNSLRML